MSKNDTRRRVLRAFFERRTDHAGAFRTIGGVLYSYNLPLARLDNEGRAVALPGLEERHSVTTSGHQTFARLAVAQGRYV